MCTRSGQAGFTLLELMLASTLGMILVISVLGILYDSVNMADVLRSRASLNAAARESFEILLDGGISGSDAIFGLRGLSSAPAAADLRETNGFRVRLLNNSAAAPLLGAQIASRNVDCAGAGDPIPACASAGTLTVNGLLGGDPELYSAARVVQSRTRELQVTLFNAFLLQRRDATAAQSKEIYRTIFLMNQD